MNEKLIALDHGGGGFQSWELLKQIRQILAKGAKTGKWKNCEDDSAIFNAGKEKIVFTTDSFIVEPIFFPGGDIGKIAMCGTINDLSVMGARPIGISLSIIMEEGFPQKDLIKIMESIAKISKEANVPIVTGDTKVTGKGKLDKIQITTAGIGLAEKIINNNGIKSGDYIIASGDLGEHTVALLSKRFNYKTKIKSDCKPLNKELGMISKYLNSCKDPTRGGLAANLVEMAQKSKIKIILEENLIPYKKETMALSELLGIDIFSFPSEGRFIAAVSPENISKTISILKKFGNPKIIGRAETLTKKTKKGKGSVVYLKTRLGNTRPIEMPKGKLIPRIC